MTITKVIKALYVKLGGSLTDTISGIADGAPVAEYTVTSDCIKALYVLYGGDLSEVYSGISDVAVKDYTSVSKALAALAKVAFKGITPTGKTTITENGENIDVAQYASADVRVETYLSELTNLIERDITSINIPNGVTVIGDYAFASCQMATNATIPNSVTEIGAHAFYMSTIQSVLIPNTVAVIQNAAFSYCTSLTDIYYTGTQAEWEAITGIADAGIPEGATIHYEYTPE